MVQRDRLRERVKYLERFRPMTSKLQGLAQAIGAVHHDLDAQAEGLLKKLDAVKVRGTNAFKGAHARLDASALQIADVEKLVADLEQTNGGPSLDGSKESSDETPKEQAWTGNHSAPLVKE